MIVFGEDFDDVMWICVVFEFSVENVGLRVVLLYLVDYLKSWYDIVLVMCILCFFCCVLIMWLEDFYVEGFCGDCDGGEKWVGYVDNDYEFF